MRLLIFLGFVLISFLTFTNFSFSHSHSVVINEIMYDLDGSDSGREWIEIFNPTSGPIDLTGWRFEEGGTQHVLNPFQGGLIVSAGGFALIADNPDLFLQDYTGFSGIVIDSSFSLSNSGEI